MPQRSSQRPAPAVSQAPVVQPVSTQAKRETVESIIVAVILAFLFRAFVAEAFIIPTGSMAPTLQGAHVDVTCNGCNFSYRCGASVATPNRIVCPNCGQPKMLEGGRFSNESPFPGDRILVSKFAYELGDPQRWDVIVFKFPGNAKQNYIKRLVGMPEELVMVRHGNAFVSPTLFSIDAAPPTDDEGVSAAIRSAFKANGIELSAGARLELARALTPFDMDGVGDRAWLRRIVDSKGSYLITEHRDKLRVHNGEFEIPLRPDHKLMAMLQCVHDSQHTNEKLTNAGWPTQWKQQQGWKSNDAGKSYSVDSTDGVAWLNFCRRLPSGESWGVIDAGGKVSIVPEVGELITDNYAYNYPATSSRLGKHWVSDLGVELTAKSDGNGAILVGLVRAGVLFQCRFDLKTGDVQLETFGEGRSIVFDNNHSPAKGEGPWPKASSNVTGPGKYQLRMTNVDNEIRVWVDGTRIEFDMPATYDPPVRDVPAYSAADPGDTEPVRIGCESGSLQVEKLRVLRDTYYVATNADSNLNNEMNLFSNHEQFWADLWQAELDRFDNRGQVTYCIGEDAYFPMGDNSPFSEDARRWSKRQDSSKPPHYVSRELMIGKAVMIYWPHAWRPFWPNFGRMGVIR